MKVKDLIKELQKYDPDAYVSVKYYGEYDVDPSFDELASVIPQYSSVTKGLSPLILTDSVVHIEEEYDE